MPSGVLRERHDVEGTHDGTAHGLLDDAVVREHVGLAFRSGGAVAPHGGKDEWLHAARDPVLRDRSGDGRDVGDAAAAHSDRDARPGLEIRAEARPAHFELYGGGDIGEPAVGKILANDEDARKLHIGIIAGGMLVRHPRWGEGRGWGRAARNAV